MGKLPQTKSKAPEAPIAVQMELPDNNPKTAFGVQKPAMGLIPSTSLIELAMAMKLGADKYGPYNWRSTSVSAMVYVNAMERHLRSWLDGEDLDIESGVSHIAHVMACCSLLLDSKAIGNLVDDRPVKAPTAELIRAYTRKKG